MKYSRIIGTGSYFPKNIRTNSDLEKMVDTSNEWILSRTGIKERRIANSEETVSLMGYEAALNAISYSGIDKNDIDLIIVATSSSSRAFPSSACEVHRRLGIKECIAFDIGAACSGFVYALSVADQYIKSGSVKKALIIGSDRLAHMCNPKDRSTVILFGDGAGAAILESSEEAGILSTHINADGQYGDLLSVNNVQHDKPFNNDDWLSMTGNAVMKMAVQKLSKLVVETLKHNGLSNSDLDWLVPHQANLRIIQATAKKLDLPLEQVMINLDRYGNTSAATIPTALDEGVRNNKIKKNQLLLLEAFGGGFTWGSALVKF